MRRRWLDKITRRQVLVHTRDDRTLKGALAGVYDDALVLDHAIFLSPDGQANELVGRITVPRDNVSFVQETSPPTSDGTL